MACENVGALARLPDLLEAHYLALEREVGKEDLGWPQCRSRSAS
jgi:hypothetical protein